MGGAVQTLTIFLPIALGMFLMKDSKKSHKIEINDNGQY
jgi:hypothetical protein